MIEFFIRSEETRKEAAQPPNKGNSPKGCKVVSKAKTADASIAREAPEKIAAIPTSAASRGSTSSQGASDEIALPITAPTPPPIVKSGASVPPDVPLPSEIDQDTNFSEH